jgi:hypothetical protein
MPFALTWLERNTSHASIVPAASVPAPRPCEARWMRHHAAGIACTVLSRSASRVLYTAGLIGCEHRTVVMLTDPRAGCRFEVFRG